MIPLIETLEINLWLKFLVDATMKSFLIIAVAGLFGFILRRRSAAMRGLVWNLAILGCLIVPLFSLTLPQWEVGVLPATPEGFEMDRLTDNQQAAISPVPIKSRPLSTTTTSPAQATPIPIQPEATISEIATRQSNTLEIGLASLHWTDWIAVCWVAGALFLIARLIVGIGAVWCLSASSDNFNGSISQVHPDWKGTVSIRQNKAVAVPMVWGLFRPVVLLPADACEWEPERQRAVLLHELAHIQRQDWLMQTMAQITCAVYWFNPLVWFAARWMRTEVERACDDHVLNAGYQSTDYAQHLLDIVRNIKVLRSVSRETVAMARSSKIEGRLKTILAKHRNRRPVTKITIVIGLLVLICFAVPMGVMRLTKAVDPIGDPAVLNEEYERKEQIYGLINDGVKRGMYSLLRSQLILGKPTPKFSHTSLHGVPVSLNALQGKVVVLYHWSTQIDETDILKLKRLYETHAKNSNFVLITICVPSGVTEEEAEVKQFAETHAIPGLHLFLKPEAVPFPFAVAGGWPYYIVIDKTGILREGDRDHALRELEIKQLVTALLVEGTDSNSARIIPRISQIRTELYISQGQKEKATAEYEKLLAFLYQKREQTGQVVELIDRAYDRMTESRELRGFSISNYGGELVKLHLQQHNITREFEADRQIDKQRIHRKQSLEKLAQQPLTANQQHLLTQLLNNNGSLEQVLSSETYLAYLEAQYGQIYKDFAAYVAAMPTPKQKTDAQFALKSVLSPMIDLFTLPSATKAKELQICMNLYFKARKQLPQGSKITNHTEWLTTEFIPLFMTYFFRPMKEMYTDTLLDIDKNWTDSHTWGLYRRESNIHGMGEVIYLIADDDTTVFQNAFRERLEKFGSREGLLRCAIGFPDEFALMYSFFKDSTALEKWILAPPSPSEEKGIFLRPPSPE